METIFDFSQLTDRNLKRLYEYIPSRGNEVIESFRAAYSKTSDYYCTSSTRSEQMRLKKRRDGFKYFVGAEKYDFFVVEPSLTV